MRYSLRTLLILMLLVGPLCVYGWPGYRAWQDYQTRAAEERRELAKMQQEVSRLDQVVRSLGLSGIPARTGKESKAELQEMERHVYREVFAQLMNETGGPRVAKDPKLQLPTTLIYRIDPKTGKGRYE